jgi:hypothetical protein
MIQAVYLNNQAFRMAIKIDDVRPDGMLTPEFQVLQLMIPQGLPQQAFCACHAHP